MMTDIHNGDIKMTRPELAGRKKIVLLDCKGRSVNLGIDGLKTRGEREEVVGGSSLREVVRS